MAFPITPSLNNEHTVNGITYIYNGAAWNIKAGTVSGTIDGLSDVDITTVAIQLDEGLKWNGTKFVPATLAAGGSEHYDQDATPTPSATGATWYVPSTGTVYKYVNDGTSNVWVDISTAGAGTSGGDLFIDGGTASSIYIVAQTINGGNA